ncbi:MAG: nucleoside phosphorylase [Rubritepida sp.]|jgi:hopanoid-associated phosphorylase|nr:nucleoside phosphorylase [Rubritepida sp.]MCU0945384.1 nucleoside phosphorylase [Rubritepida sp.]
MRLPEGCVVAVGLASEARCLPPGTRVLVSAGDPARLAAALAALPPGEARALLSFGIAGGLAPGTRAGDLLVAEALREGDEFHLPDAAWSARLQAASGARPGVLAASARLVASPAEKRALHAATRALAVDMESGVVARHAAAQGLPFAVLRAVADGPEEALPRAAADALTPSGEPALGRVLAALARRPWELPALLRLGRASARAHAALRAIRWDGA